MVATITQNKLNMHSHTYTKPCTLTYTPSFRGCGQIFVLTHTADDLQKIWFERASTHEKSINVRLFDQVSAISRVDGSAVNYDGGGSSGVGVLVD